MHCEPPQRRLCIFLFLLLASIIIISPHYPIAFAGACGSGEGDCDQDSFTPNEGDCDDYNANVYPVDGVCEVPPPENTIEIKSDVKNGVVVGPNETVVISNSATVDGNLQVNGGTLVIKDDTTVNGNLESVGGTIKIEGGSIITGNVQIKVSGAGGVLEIKDSTLFGNIETNNLDTLIIMNVNLGGNIKSENNNNVSITGNTVSGNIEIKGTLRSCTETGNNVKGNIDGCP